MAIDATGRDSRVQELCARLGDNKSLTGKRRTIAQVLEVFVNGLLKSMDDSTELIDILGILVIARDKMMSGVLNPHKPSHSMPSPHAGRTMAMEAVPPTVTNT